MLHEAGIDPARVVCELTEKKSGSDEAIFGFVQALKAAGFRIAVDDFGADKSDIGRILEIKPDIVKFDAAWITRLMESDPGAALLAAMVEKFRSMGIQTVFEGLEERWQLDLADTCRVDMVQGYILARPELVASDELSSASIEAAVESELKRPMVCWCAHTRYPGRRGVRLAAVRQRHDRSRPNTPPDHRGHLRRRGRPTDRRRRIAP